jgi:hypothetical protein
MLLRCCDNTRDYAVITFGEGTHIGTLDVGRARWLGTASRVRAASIAGVNSEGRDTMNMHGAPWCPPCPDGHPWVVSHGSGNKSATWKDAGEKGGGVWCSRCPYSLSVSCWLVCPASCLSVLCRLCLVKRGQG